MTDFLNEMRNKATKPIVDSIKNKANWSYHPLTKSYTLIGAYDLKFFTFAELSALFKKHLNKKIILP